MKIFKYIGLIVLMCFSFFYTEKTALVVRQYDEIMIKIREQKDDLKTNYINAEIKDNNIIPGIAGSEIDENKSYTSMKRYGMYDESLMAYKNIKPKISINQNKNKYIKLGNPKKNMVSLIFMVERTSKIDTIINILEDKKIEASFFLDGTWLVNNIERLIVIKKYNHTLGNIGYNYDYSDTSWINKMILDYQKNNYCFLREENITVLNKCAKEGSYTILSSTIFDKGITNNVKSEISPGSIITIYINNNTVNELPNLINYILSKGYKITSLDEHIQE